MPLKSPVARRAYQSKYMRERWYPANRAKHACVVRKREADLLTKLQALKLASGCADCGYDKHAVALDFDHVRGNKSINISVTPARGWSWDRIESEIALCDVVCANCHRVRTARRISGRVLI